MSQQINLFNPAFRKQRNYLSAAAMAQVLVAVVVGLALFAGYSFRQVAVLNKDAETSAMQLAASKTQLDKLAAELAARRKNQALENEIRQAEAELASVQQVFNVLQKGELGNTKGYAEYMHAFARRPLQGVWLTGFNIQGGGSAIVLQGRALKAALVPAYIGQLKNEAALHGKTFAALEIREPVVLTGDRAAAAGEQKTPPAYVEFTLRTEAPVKGQGEQTGTGRK